MIYKATELAIKEMNKVNIDEKAILLDRAILKRDLNPLSRLFNVVTEMEGDDQVNIYFPFDNIGKEMLFDVEYKDGLWIKK